MHSVLNLNRGTIASFLVQNFGKKYTAQQLHDFLGIPLQSVRTHCYELVRLAPSAFQFEQIRVRDKMRKVFHFSCISRAFDIGAIIPQPGRKIA